MKKTILSFILILTLGLGQIYAQSALASVSQTPNDFSIELKNFVRLYPNPTVKQLHIAVTDYEYNALEVKITDILGNVVNKVVVHREAAKNGIHQIDVNSLAKGVYILRLMNTSDNQSYTKRFIKN